MDATKFGSLTELAGLFGLQERQHDMFLCVRMNTSSPPLAQGAAVLLCLVSLGIHPAFRSIHSQGQTQVEADGSALRHYNSLISRSWSKHDHLCHPVRKSAAGGGARDGSEQCSICGCHISKPNSAQSNHAAGRLQEKVPVR